MRVLAGFVCLYCAMMAGQSWAQSHENDFSRMESRRLTAEFTPAPYGTHTNSESVRKWKRHWAISAMALVAASVLDAGSSWGKPEANPALQQAGGAFGGRSAGIKLGITAVPLLLQFFAARNNEGLYRSFAVANYAGAGFFTAVAVRNYRVTQNPGN